MDLLTQRDKYYLLSWPGVGAWIFIVYLLIAGPPSVKHRTACSEECRRELMALQNGIACVDFMEPELVRKKRTPPSVVQAVALANASSPVVWGNIDHYPYFQVRGKDLIIQKTAQYSIVWEIVFKEPESFAKVELYKNDFVVQTRTYHCNRTLAKGCGANHMGSTIRGPLGPGSYSFKLVHAKVAHAGMFITVYPDCY